MRNSKKIRTRRGAMLGYVIGSTFFLSVVGVGIIGLIMLMGGSRQGTNANDAGTLNVGKCAPKIQISGNQAELDLFRTYAENGQFFSLKNINSVSAHTLLVLLNQRSMEIAGTSSSASQANALATVDAAEAISSRLSIALNRQANHEPRFKSVAQSHVMRMLDADQKLDPVPGTWKTSLLNRGTQSNVRFLKSQIPPEITLPSDAIIQNKQDKQYYFTGYTPIPAWNGRSINFVPFEYKGTPHLVSLQEFEKNTLANRPYEGWQNPVPNAFHARSRTQDAAQRSHVFNSAALCNVMTRRYEPPTIKSGFIRFSLGNDQVKWFPSGIHTETDTLHDKRTRLVSKSGLIDPLAPGTWWDIKLNYGAQYVDTNNSKTLYKAIYGLSDFNDGVNNHQDGMYAGLNKLIATRVNQIKPGASLAQVIALMKSKELKSFQNSFVIGPNKSGNLIIVDEFNASEVANLDAGTQLALQNRAHADGLLIKAEKQELPSPATYSRCDHIMFGIRKKWFGFTTWRHELEFQPGTGANSALLDVRQRDFTAAYFNSLSGDCWP